MKVQLVVLMEDLDHQRKSLLLILVKQTQNFVRGLHSNADNSYLFVNGKEIFKFKIDNEMLTFQLNFVTDVYLMNLVLLSLEKYL